MIIYHKPSDAPSQTDRHEGLGTQTQMTGDFLDLPVIFDVLNLAQLTADTLAKISAIEAVLPQTQCGLCGYRDGCLPYSHAIVTQGEATNRCVPGGKTVSLKISQIMGMPYQSPVASRWDIDPNTDRPIEVRAVIDESECIGCTKCIPACPVDAIIGTGKHMHSIITDLCTGCELCIPPCPVDCIDLEAYPRVLSDADRQAEQQDLKARYHNHLRRVEGQALSHAPTVSVVQSTVLNALSEQSLGTPVSEHDAKNAIVSAKLRTELKKLKKQRDLSLARGDSDKQASLALRIAGIEKQLIDLGV